MLYTGPSEPGGVEPQAGPAAAVAGAAPPGVAGRQRDRGPAEARARERPVGQPAARHLHVAAAVQGAPRGPDHRTSVRLEVRRRHRSARGECMR